MIYLSRDTAELLRRILRGETAHEIRRGMRLTVGEAMMLMARLRFALGCKGGESAADAAHRLRVSIS